MKSRYLRRLVVDSPVYRAVSKRLPSWWRLASRRLFPLGFGAGASIEADRCKAGEEEEGEAD